jgi:uncharacterized membrane protein
MNVDFKTDFDDLEVQIEVLKAFFFNAGRRNIVFLDVTFFVAIRVALLESVIIII